MNQASVKQHGPTAPSVYRPQAVPKVLQPKLAAVRPPIPVPRGRALGVVQRAEVLEVKDESAPNENEWTDAVTIGLPARKHILELMTLQDANGKKKCSVVELAVATTAVEAIQKHVNTHGWKSADGITVEWIRDQQCFKVTYKGNQWMTHTKGSGQLWPLRGADIFSPPEGEDVRKEIGKWKGGRVRPSRYMNV